MCQAVRPSWLWPNTKQVKSSARSLRIQSKTLASPDPYSGRNTQGRSQLFLASPPSNLLVFQATTTSSYQTQSKIQV